MKYEHGIIYGSHCVLRPVKMEDAEFIVALRNDPKLSRYISKGAESVEGQRQWIQDYFDRNHVGLEYYFIACDLLGTPWGTIRIYNIRETECTGGSWVMRAGAPASVSLQTYMLAMRFSFEVLSKEIFHIDVRKENIRVWKWHEHCGAVFLREDHLDRYYDYTLAEYSIAERIIQNVI